jgi:hypothetical protein
MCCVLRADGVLRGLNFSLVSVKYIVLEYEKQIREARRTPNV